MFRNAMCMTATIALLTGVSRGSAQGPTAAPVVELAPGPAPPAAAPRDTAGAFETLVGGEREELERREEGDEIETDRNSFTPASSVVGRRRAVVESAYSFVDNRRGLETHSLPELLVRYGLTERVELRVGFNYEVGGGSNEITASGAGFNEAHHAGRVGPEREGLERETKVTYGVKLRLTDQNRWLPRSAVILMGTTPTGGSPGSATATQLIATGVAGWELANRWRFDTAIRYGTASAEGDLFSRWAPSAVLRVPVGERWGVHAEYFGVFSAGRPENTAQHYFSHGAHFLVTRDLEVGVRVGWGLNDQSTRFFTNVGLGWRF
jgi:hypothetical protein